MEGIQQDQRVGQAANAWHTHSHTHSLYLPRLSPSRKPSYTLQGGPHPPCINILYVPKSTSKP